MNEHESSWELWYNDGDGEHGCEASDTNEQGDRDLGSTSQSWWTRTVGGRLKSKELSGLLVHACEEALAAHQTSLTSPEMLD